jgi:hypothetical protein
MSESFPGSDALMAEIDALLAEEEEWRRLEGEDTEYSESHNRRLMKAVGAWFAGYVNASLESKGADFRVIASPQVPEGAPVRAVAESEAVS